MVLSLASKLLSSAKILTKIKAGLLLTTVLLTGAVVTSLPGKPAVSQPVPPASSGPTAPVALPTAVPSGTYTWCSAEGGKCEFEGTGTVRFGTETQYITATATGSMACTNGAFGTDPAPGVVKQCWASTKVLGATSGVSRPFQLGVNLVSGVYWSGEQVFTNLATSDEWAAEFNPDEMGNITIPAGKTARRLLHPPVAVLNHTAKVDVVCTWEGGASGYLDGMHRGTKPWSMVPGKLTFEWNGLAPDAGNNTWIDFRNGAAVRNLECHEASADPKQLFSSEFLESVKPYSVLRNLDWSPANGNPKAASLNWAKRTKPGSIDQLANGHIAYEYLVDLSNINKSAPWFTLPYNADAAYLRSFAQMVHDRLDPSLPVYVELSNEVWNAQFGANADARREGMAAKLNDNEWIAGHLAYAAKFKAAMAVVSEVFKDRPDKLVRVYGAWSGSPWHTELAFNEGKIAGSVDAVAIAPYFGHDLPKELAGVTDRAQRIAALNRAVDKSIGEMAAQKAMTNKYGVRLIAYEAGQHIVGGDNNLTADLNRDPAMYDAYKRYIGAWRDTAGDLMTMYNTTGSISQYGAWGMREYAGQPLAQTPKRRAALEFGRK
jgi:hypothetical protein